MKKPTKKSKFLQNAEFMTALLTSKNSAFLPLSLLMPLRCHNNKTPLLTDPLIVLAFIQDISLSQCNLMAYILHCASSSASDRELPHNRNI